MAPVRWNAVLFGAALILSSGAALALGLEVRRLRSELTRPLPVPILEASELPARAVRGDTTRLVLVLRPSDCPASGMLARQVERTVREARSAGARVAFSGVLFDSGSRGETPRVLSDWLAAGVPVTPVPRMRGLGLRLAAIGHRATPVLLAFDGGGRLRAALPPDRLTHAEVLRLAEGFPVER